MKPPTRSRRSARQDYVPITNKPWSLKEKKLLLEALKKYASTDYDALQKHIQTRNTKEVEYTVKAYILRAKSSKGQVFAKKAHDEPALDVWVRKCREELAGRVDFSHNVASVAEALALTEPVPDDAQPFNYSKIYSYLGMLLRDKAPSYLLPADAFLVLHLLDCVAGSVKAHDFSAQKSFLVDKFYPPPTPRAAVNCPAGKEAVSTSASAATCGPPLLTEPSVPHGTEQQVRLEEGTRQGALQVERCLSLEPPPLPPSNDGGASEGAKSSEAGPSKRDSAALRKKVPKICQLLASPACPSSNRLQRGSSQVMTIMPQQHSSPQLTAPLLLQPSSHSTISPPPGTVQVSGALSALRESSASSSAPDIARLARIPSLNPFGIPVNLLQPKKQN